MHKEASAGSSEEEEELAPPLPPRPTLPEPPTVGYRRPEPPPDPTEGPFRRRGLGAREVGTMGKAMGIGTTLVSSIIGGVIVGWLLDTYVIKAATPYGLIVGFLLGTFSGFANMIKLANELNK